jgi:hypothetical protein
MRVEKSVVYFVRILSEAQYQQMVAQRIQTRRLLLAEQTRTEIYPTPEPAFTQQFL